MTNGMRKGFMRVANSTKDMRAKNTSIRQNSSVYIKKQPRGHFDRCEDTCTNSKEVLGVNEVA